MTKLGCLVMGLYGPFDAYITASNGPVVVAFWQAIRCPDHCRLAGWVVAVRLAWLQRDHLDEVQLGHLSDCSRGASADRSC